MRADISVDVMRCGTGFDRCGIDQIEIRTMLSVEREKSFFLEEKKVYYV